MKLKRIFSSLAAVSMAVSGFIPMVSRADIGYVGQNIIDSKGTVYMITGDGYRRPYTSAGAFLSYGFNNWSNVSPASNEDLSLPVGSFIPPQDGKVMCSDRGADRGTCYLITNSTKAGFVSEAVFKSHGYTFDKAMYGDISFLSSASNVETTTEAHRPGTLINLNNTVYLVTGNGLLGFPNLSVFNSWGYNFGDVVTANTADAAMPVKNVVPGRANGLLNPNTTNVIIDPVPQVYNITTALHSSSPSGTITPGSGKDLLRFTIQAPANYSVTLRQLGFDFGGTYPTGALSNLKLIYNLTGNEVGSNSGNVLNDRSILMMLGNGIGMGSSFSADFTLRADVSSVAAGSTVSARLIQAWTGDGATATLAQNIYGLPVAGNTLSVANATAPLVITSPSYNDTWTIGSTYAIRWSGGSASPSVNIRLDGQTMPSCPSGTSCAQVMPVYYIARSVVNSGVYNWQIKTTDVDNKTIPAGTYKVSVENGNPGEMATSAAVITLQPYNSTYIQLLSPRSGASWVKGAPSTVTFSANGINAVNVYLIPYYPCLYTAPACSIQQPTPYRVAQNVSTAYAGIGISVGRDIADNRDIPTGQYLIQITDNSTGQYQDISPQPITLTQ